jgi:hypothetical protein
MENMERTQLFEKLDSMKIEPEGAALTFPKRLARENGWSLEFAERVCGEYKRFLYLAATSGHPVTPSDEVDQAWHLHLTYTRHYWDVLCAQILEKPLHHGPTEGGAVEGQRYRDQYEATLKSYAAAFGAEPPSDIWPPTAQRFGTIYRRVVAGQHWMVRKKPVYAALPFLTLAACTSGDSIWPVAGFVLVGVAVVVHLRDLAVKAKNKKDDGDVDFDFSSGDSSSSDSGGDSGGSGCGGGCGGCGG